MATNVCGPLMCTYTHITFTHNCTTAYSFKNNCCWWCSEGRTATLLTSAMVDLPCEALIVGKESRKKSYFFSGPTTKALTLFLSGQTTKKK